MRSELNSSHKHSAARQIDKRGRCDGYPRDLQDAAL